MILVPMFHSSRCQDVPAQKAYFGTVKDVWNRKVVPVLWDTKGKTRHISRSFDLQWSIEISDTKLELNLKTRTVKSVLANQVDPLIVFHKSVLRVPIPIFIPNSPLNVNAFVEDVPRTQNFVPRIIFAFQTRNGVTGSTIVPMTNVIVLQRNPQKPPNWWIRQLVK